MDTTRKLQDFLTDDYSPQDLTELESFLQAHNTLTIPPASNGLFTAVSGMSNASVTGYQDFWLRDNVMIASSFLFRGHTETAINTMKGLTRLLRTQKRRFKEMINHPERKENVQERPHVRFSSAAGSKKWSHAQNDALGYTLLLRFVLANSKKLNLANTDFELFNLFPPYFEAIEYWKDPDSGAWEEDRKVNSSSVGAVMAGLREMQVWLQTNKPRQRRLREQLEGLIHRGKLRLRKSIPFESPPQRLADAATLLLIHPSDVLNPEQKDAVLHEVEANLVRDIGIIRYSGDSYYGQDYPDWFPSDQLTGDFSEQIEIRNAKLRPGFEAQWCIFDPLLSVIYAKKFLRRVDNREYRRKQTHFFNRSLRQLTPELQCPELYFFRHGKWVPNPNTPLAWTQANLALALDYMKRSAAIPA